MTTAAISQPAQAAAVLFSQLGHSIRVRAVAAIVANDNQPASPSEIADHLGEPLGVVAYHTRQLDDAGIFHLVGEVPRRGAVEHFYAVADPAKMRALLQLAGVETLPR